MTKTRRLEQCQSLAPRDAETQIEAVVIQVASRALRSNAERREAKRKSGGTDEKIEAALLSPKVQREMDSVAAAYLREQTPKVIRLVFREALNKQSWACKIVLEMSGAADLIRAALSAPAEEPADVFISSAVERSILERHREYLRNNNATEPEPRNL